MKQALGISVDVDSIRSHLRGYGITDAKDNGAEYRQAIPRALELFRACGIKATFFLIAEDAERNQDIARQIIEEGHEVACHTMTHPLPFDVDNGEVIEREIIKAKDLLAEITQTAINGFRAPSWSFSMTLCQVLMKAGYRYDASSYPSPLLFLLRSRLPSTRRSRRDRIWLASCPLPTPHRLPGGIVEIPLATTPILRLPVYHTLSFLLPRMVFNTLVMFADMRSTPLSYVFHAVDFLDAKQDNLDPRITRHPGMRLPLEQKLKLVQSVLKKLSSRRGVLTLGQIADIAE